MHWNRVKQYLKADPSDLIEVHFYDLDRQSWQSLFAWIQEKTVLLDCQFGRLNADELSLEDFLAGKMSYIAHIKTQDGDELSLSIIEEDELTIDIEVGELDSEDKLERFLNKVVHIADIIGCNHYIICPEFETEKAFIVNGQLSDISV